MIVSGPAIAAPMSQRLRFGVTPAQQHISCRFSLFTSRVPAIAAKLDAVSLSLAVLAAVLAPFPVLVDDAVAGRVRALVAVCHRSLLSGNLRLRHGPHKQDRRLSRSTLRDRGGTTQRFPRVAQLQHRAAIVASANIHETSRKVAEVFEGHAHAGKSGGQPPDRVHVGDCL